MKAFDEKKYTCIELPAHDGDRFVPDDANVLHR